MSGSEAHGRIAVAAMLIAALFVMAGCNHKLVARSGETTVNVYPSKKDFDNLMSMKSRGGPEGLVGGLGETFMAKKVPENTPIKVLSSDSEGADVQVLEGPNAGLRGYVAKDNVD
jgi:hypothetical protein